MVRIDFKVLLLEIVSKYMLMSILNCLKIFIFQSTLVIGLVISHNSYEITYKYLSISIVKHFNITFFKTI